MPTNYWAEFEYGFYYHIYNRSVGKEPVFRQQQWVEQFATRWEKLLGSYFDTIAFCFIPNHFHFLIHVKPEQEWDRRVLESERTRASIEFLEGRGSMDAFLLDQFRRLLGGFSLSYNRKNNRTGSLLQERFKRIQLKSESRWWWQLCYIHHNPIHHGFGNDYDAWPYSSYHLWSNRKWDELPACLGWMGESAKEARENFYRIHEDFRRDWIEGLSLDDDHVPLEIW